MLWLTPSHSRHPLFSLRPRGKSAPPPSNFSTIRHQVSQTLERGRRARGCWHGWAFTVQMPCFSNEITDTREHQAHTQLPQVVVTVGYLLYIFYALQGLELVHRYEMTWMYTQKSVPSCQGRSASKWKRTSNWVALVRHMLRALGKAYGDRRC